ncbi:hypothetical protein GOP47_0009592 [Adiantum capillus-veneris]|uniref:MYB transcription factor n=1 Tax=Adiantum capillus-veneris TaxID=13818 RepID=A0A9D4UX35_ADICA|nr:hypothetical protein GOP47_0009592 [Adiantum capillus-veneris]
MKSGAVKQKWTPEEESALRAGVEKYGAGKWRAIQKDADFGSCLISRSNVDLKDKWRNMSVSANGLGSRERAARILAAKMKQVGTTPGDLGTSGTVADVLSISSVAEDKKLLGARFDHLILEAILNLQDTNGGSKGRIASYLESHYPVPSNFRRLLAAKLKLLIQQGKLIKMRRHYSMTRDLGLLDESHKQQGVQGGAVKKRAHLDCQASEEIAVKFQNMAANEVAMIAAQAVADAEVAAAAAEEAARVAEIAEAEWESAEAAAEMAAALATGRSRSCN